MQENEPTRADTRHSAGPEMTVQIGPVRLRQPVLLASGTCGYGPEYADLLDFSRIGGLFTKSITVRPRKGNPPPRTVETSAGMLNAIGLANVGLEAFRRDKLPQIRELIRQSRSGAGDGEPDLAIFVNVAGHSIEEYEQVCRRLDDCEQIAGFELNVSCPNVADGLTFGTNPQLLGRLVERLRKCIARGVLIVKLSPNVADICESAKAAVEHGADALSLVNTYLGMAIDVESCRPILANRSGGLSGPAIKPMALYAVHEVYRHVAGPAGVPIIGLGGIMTWRDAAEFVLAGASAVAIGTGTFADPTIPGRVAEGLASWLHRKGFACVGEAVGKAVRPAEPAELGPQRPSETAQP